MRNKKLYVLIPLIVFVVLGGWVLTEYIQFTQRKNISLNLMSEYLNNHKSTLTEEESKLIDYKIGKIESIKSYEKGFKFSVKYSVKPADQHSKWFAGNGKITPDGWIEDKYIEVIVVKEHGKYTIKNLGIA